ncbi:MAG: hypothetical protein ACRDFS_08845, partial [Chloroflexota bacterium]
MTVHLRAGAATAIAAFLLVTSSFAAQTSLASVPRGSQASIAHSDVHPLPIESRSSGELPLDGALSTTSTIQFSVVTTGPVKENDFLGGLAAEFTDTANSTPSASDYGATFDWGDGTVMSTADGTAMITCNDKTTGQCELSVSGHAYADEATQTVTATVYPKGDTPTSASAASDQGTLTVGEADVLSADSTGLIHLSSAHSYSGPVATFTDTGYPSNAASDFTATIDWGDKSSSDGTVTGDGSGTFTVSASHTYASSGPYSVSVTLSEDLQGSAQTTATTTAGTIQFSLITTGKIKENGEFGGLAAEFTDTANSTPSAS